MSTNRYRPPGPLRSRLAEFEDTSTSFLMSKKHPCDADHQHSHFDKFQEIVDAHPSAQTIHQVTEKACNKKLLNGKVQLMVVLLQTIERFGKIASAILEDITGTVSCTIHAQVLRNPHLQPGAVIILRQVSVFCPSKKGNDCHLCITPDNIVTIYPDVSNAADNLVTKLEESVAVMGDTLSQLVDLVSTKNSASGEDSKPSAIKELLPLQTMHDIFDSEFSEELADIMVSTVWSELPEGLIERMVESAKKHIALKNKSPLPKKLILKRLREFYGNRRNTLRIKQDTVKRRARRETMKINSLIYNKRQEAVKIAIHCGEVSPDDDDAIMQVKKLVELPPRESISPSPDSDDDEEITRRKKRRLENLEKARQARQTKSRKTVTAVNMKPTPLRPIHANTQSLLNEMSNCLRAADRMYTFRDQGPENRLPFNEEEDPDATQLPPGHGYEDEYSQPIL